MAEFATPTRRMANASGHPHAAADRSPREASIAASLNDRASVTAQRRIAAALVQRRAATPVVQCFFDHGDYTFSKNQRYAIDEDGGQSSGYAAQGEAAPHQSTADGTAELPNPAWQGAAEAGADAADAAPETITYDRYKPAIDVLEDCTHGMEEIMHGQQLNEGHDVSDLIHPETGARSLWGESDALNVQRGAATDQDAEASPAVGQGYVIVRQSGDGTKYHGAAVVAKDGPDDMTMETWRRVGADEDAPRVVPTYEMYGREGEQSFQHQWRETFGNDSTVSVAATRALPAGAAVGDEGDADDAV